MAANVLYFFQCCTVLLVFGKLWNAKSAKNSSVGFENDILVF